MACFLPGVIVEDANLTVQIGALRRALGADGEALIVTVPRAGYRLVRPPREPPAIPSAPMAATIAVMPFANLNDDPQQEYFADGMVDELITALSRFKSFAVVSRTSSFAFKGKATDIRQVGRDLGVCYLLGGSVRRADDRLRVTAQLVDAETGAPVGGKVRRRDVRYFRLSGPHHGTCRGPSRTANPSRRD